MVSYIDPGTGSMLFTILLGVLSAGIYALRGLVVKLRFALSAGAKEEASKNKLPFVIFSDNKRYWNISSRSATNWSAEEWIWSI
jgi:hypothetical protein